MSEQTTTGQSLLQQCQQDYRDHQASSGANSTGVTGQLGGAISHGNEAAGSWGGATAPGVGDRY
ncbi:hypothetical protein F7Q99_38970 [Streptomyces kaniharaensis]|uniref:Uncharacterized protein n=1 Tax=Streptomyces kaniharaensis TaxID=212423 RepID=A0A6N7L404_9ACTN|nr:hypothetical protein [Streptomyces kaniharaensis]MQS18015.1 hypothetical protein [Streptomyces kaniharaensis]